MATRARILGRTALASIHALVTSQPPLARVTMEEYVKREQLDGYVRKLRPTPPTGRAREINISDDELREIEAAAANVLPKAIVNIGAVVEGCPNEDGPKCTDQVWVIASRPTESKGLLFSRIHGSWDVGPVQKWWLEYDDVPDHARSLFKRGDHLTALRHLLERATKCAAIK